MKFNCGASWREKRERLSEWHDHFALWPVTVASEDCRWLETVERKGRFWACDIDWGWDWEYRPKSPQTGSTAPPPANPATD